MRDGLYMEDDLLWLKMIAAGAKTGNLDQILCKVRVGAGMFERRGGLRYLKLYRPGSSAHAEERANFLHGVCQECCHSDDCCPLSRICPTVYFMKLLRKSK